MISYTTTEYYNNKYLMGRQAVISAALIPFYILKATQKIKEYVFDNVDETAEFTSEIQMCCCELAEYLYKQDNPTHDKDISSEKVGEYSVSYVSGQTAEDIKQSTIKGIIYNWLCNTDYLYWGC